MFGAQGAAARVSVLVSENEHAIQLPPWQESCARYLAERASSEAPEQKAK